MCKDMKGKELAVGQYVVYGKSNTYDPISLGHITDIANGDIYIMAEDAKRVSKIPKNHAGRILVLVELWSKE